MNTSFVNEDFIGFFANEDFIGLGKDLLFYRILAGRCKEERCQSLALFQNLREMASPWLFLAKKSSEKPRFFRRLPRAKGSSFPQVSPFLVESSEGLASGRVTTDFYAQAYCGTKAG